MENKMATSVEDRDGGALSVKGFRQEALGFMSRTLFRSNAGVNGGACAFTELTLLKLDIKRCHFIQNEGSGTSGGALAVGTMDSHLNNATINIHDSNFTGNKIYNVNHLFSLGELPWRGWSHGILCGLHEGSPTYKHQHRQKYCRTKDCWSYKS